MKKPKLSETSRKSKKKDTSSIGKKEFVSRIPCKYWLEGACQKGDECTFSHNIIPQKKDTICKFFITGNCLKGEEACIYLHG
jgi:hypothetical protein